MRLAIKPALCVLAAGVLAVGCSGGEKAAAPTTSAPTPPRTASTTALGVPAARATTPRACPSHISTEVPTARNESEQKLRTKLVPFAASGARVCNYAPPGVVNGTLLVGSSVLSSAAAARLEDDANRLGPEHALVPLRSCDAEPASTVDPGPILNFANGSQQVSIETYLRPSGYGPCSGSVTNGVRNAALTSAWIGELRQFTTTVTGPRPDVLGPCPATPPFAVLNRRDAGVRGLATTMVPINLLTFADTNQRVDITQEACVGVYNGSMSRCHRNVARGDPARHDLRSPLNS